MGFDEGSNHYFPAPGASPTRLVVNADLRSGSFDLDLAVSGAWRCPPDVQAPHHVGARLCPQGTGVRGESS